MSCSRPAAPRPCREEGSPPGGALLSCTQVSTESRGLACQRAAALPPHAGRGGGSEVTELPNPVCLPLYKCDIYRPSGPAKPQLRFQGPLCPSKSSCHLSQLPARTRAHTRLKLFPLLIFFCVALRCQDHFALFSPILNSFITTSSKTQERLAGRAGVSTSSPGRALQESGQEGQTLHLGGVQRSPPLRYFQEPQARSDGSFFL